MTIELTRLMLIAPVFLAAGAIASAILNSEDRFGAASLAPVSYNACIIIGALLLAPWLGVYGAAIGVVIGSVAHLLVQVPALRRRFHYTFRADISDEAARQSFWLMLPRAIGMGANQITFLVNTALATTVAVGAVVSYNVAFNVLQIPLGVIGLPLGIVLLPAMSRALAGGEGGRVRAHRGELAAPPAVGDAAGGGGRHRDPRRRSRSCSSGGASMRRPWRPPPRHSGSSCWGCPRTRSTSSWRAPSTAARTPSRR